MRELRIPTRKTHRIQVPENQIFFLLDQTSGEANTRGYTNKISKIDEVAINAKERKLTHNRSLEDSSSWRDERLDRLRDRCDPYQLTLSTVQTEEREVALFK